jgi:sugar lactone lactonase YvrE
MLAGLARPAALTALLVAVLAALTAFAASGDTAADRVFGQGGNFGTNTQNNGGVGSSSLYAPFGIALDGAGRLWVADDGNNRVLEYDNPLTSAVATRVFGQPDFTSNALNNGGISASTLAGAIGLAVDGSGRLWVVDGQNARVLEYDSPLTSPVATRVFGQPDFTSLGGGTGASRLFEPIGIALDSGGRLWVGDSNNFRVLEYDTPLMNPTATHVFGQPDFTSDTPNNGGISASSLAGGHGIAVDGVGRLWVSDFYNRRVLEYDNPLTSAVATRVFGQPDFTSNTPNNGGISASSLGTDSGGPAGIVIDSSGRLWVADEANNRVLEYDGVAPSPVGGIAELPDLAGASAQQAGAPADGSAASPANYAALTASFAAAAVLITIGAWYARRRWLR